MGLDCLLAINYIYTTCIVPAVAHLSVLISM